MQNMKVILIYPHIIRRFPNMGTTMNKVNKFLDKEHSLLVCGQSGCGKTIIAMLMLRKPLVYFDKIYLYTRNEPQDKIQDLKKIIDHVSDEVGYDVMEKSLYLSLISPSASFLLSCTSFHPDEEERQGHSITRN